MPLHPIIALDHILQEYEDHLVTEFRARDESLRQALVKEIEKPLFLAQEPFYQAHRPFRSGRKWRELALDAKLCPADGTTAFLHARWVGGGVRTRGALGA